MDLYDYQLGIYDKKKNTYTSKGMIKVNCEGCKWRTYAHWCCVVQGTTVGTIMDLDGKFCESIFGASIL